MKQEKGFTSENIARFGSAATKAGCNIMLLMAIVPVIILLVLIALNSK